MKKITTKRLILRKPSLNDLNDLFEYAKSPEVGPSAGWLPHQTIEYSKEILNNFIRSEDVWAIELKAEKKMIGTISLYTRDFEDAILGIVELGYTIGRNYWNMGYASESVSAMIEFAFKKLKINKIVCGHTIDNERSKKIILKNNFKFTHMDDTRIFSVDSIKEVLMYELDNPYKKEHKK